jgi:hypothetical protein
MRRSMVDNSYHYFFDDVNCDGFLLPHPALISLAISYSHGKPPWVFLPMVKLDRGGFN